ncbi:MULTISPECIES: glycerol-3-phosphate dehydrogenase/oxidase [Allobacillus]|uniref:glycerol-3-phosphate dehydrogenase/oxidase n=1 Tax=Allobacillus TaxID=1400133 RepID=UPI001FECD774|nr:glycerol-3-phosphate dehydrogenase/oxidase [Allobacillus salarius]
MTNTFSNKYRQEAKQQLNKQFDLIIVGGGITGAGIALDAVTRGLNVALFEMQDFAAGTSSRSTKLVHGGLRYLKNFEIKMVAEVGKEREIVYENGPHITTPEWMLLPFYDEGTFGPFTTNIGLRLYDFLAGVKKKERRKMLNKEETLNNEPLLRREGLAGSGYYVEYKTDDARLTMEILKKAVENGAVAFNYMKVDQFLYRDGKVVGVEAVDQLNDESVLVYADKVVNAAGPWVDELRAKDNPSLKKPLFHTKGVHLVFDNIVFPLTQAIYFDSPDGRMIFAIPRDGKTYVGTTDTAYTGDLENPTASLQDRTYLMRAIHEMFPTVNVNEQDIESSWSGIRPLIQQEGKDPSEISRKDEIFISDSQLISIAGGKLTGYRKMAQSIVDLVASQWKSENGRKLPESKTKKMPLAGGEVGGSKGFEQFKKKVLQSGYPEEMLEKWVNRYGANTEKLIEFYETAIHEHVFLEADIWAELMYTLECEAVYKPVDFFIRRTGALFFDIEFVKKYKKPVIQEMKDYFQWDDQKVKQHTEELDKAIYEAQNPVKEELK